ncbi:MAG: hypothetical protein QOG60_1045 [Frankiaceae bacterium]|nr:hypothetical protein [Frankiaceae bacterium]
MRDRTALSSVLTQPPARLGSQLVVGCSALITVTAWAVVPEGRLSRAYLVCGLVIVVALALCRVPGIGRDCVRCLPFPLLLLVELLGLGLLGPSGVQPYLAMVPLAFIYVGLTCRPNRSWWLLPLACATWLVAYDVPSRGPDAQVFIRLPISMVVWLLIAELLSQYVTAVRKQAENLADDAATDLLTGLPNRRALGPVLNAVEPGDALVMLDVDHFRDINERHGHAGGDEILRRLGAVVRGSLRGGDSALRYGGEEILLRLCGIGDLSSLEQTLQRLQTAWRQIEPTVTFSGGGVILAPDSDATGAVRVADACLYEAKLAGRNCVRLRDLRSDVTDLQQVSLLRH